MSRLLRRVRDQDAGAATLEYAGMLLVVVAILGSLLAMTTPVGSALLSKICQALEVSCGGAAGQDRAESLNIPCVTRQDDRALGYNVSVEFVRVDRKDTDQITVNADGSATVKVSQGGGVGLEASAQTLPGGEGGPDAEVGGRVSANGDLAYVYNFPVEYGGADAARRFLQDRRGGVDQAVDIVVPGAQTVREGAEQAGNWTHDRWDDITDFFGHGPSAEQIAQREREQAARTSDAIEVSLSLQGEAGVSADAGIARAEVGVKGEVKGTASAALTTSGPDAGTTSFTGSAQFQLTGEATLGLADEAGNRALPPLLNIGGEYGKQVSYQVTFDAQGNPTTLVIATETTTRGGLGIAPATEGGGSSAEGKARSTVGRLNISTSTLDLTGPDNAANRAAFDQVFTTYGVSAGDHQVRVADLRLQGLPSMVDSWSALQGRLDADAYEATYDYDLQGDSLSGQGTHEAKEGGYGVGGESTEDTRRLTGATGRDNRAGGVEQALATCG